MSMKLLDVDKVDRIIIHCTDTRPDSSIDVDTIAHWHLSRGFDTIGYHYLIRPNGEICLGRSTDYIGAHCLGANYRSIGVAYVGGRNRLGAYADTRTVPQKASLCYLVVLLMRQFPNIRYVQGHNDFATKACPCFDATREYDKFVRDVLDAFNNYK